MKKITLICTLGMSTSMLAIKMQKAAKDLSLDAEIRAVPESTMKDYESDTDLILLGPQIGFMLKKVKETYEPKGIKVAVINSRDYGLLNGEKVLQDSLALIS
jgi:cellobiose PTS system EIIB component